VRNNYFVAARLPKSLAISKSTKSPWWKIIDWTRGAMMTVGKWMA